MAVTCNNCGYCDMLKKGSSSDIEIYFCPKCGNLQGECVNNPDKVEHSYETLKKGA